MVNKMISQFFGTVNPDDFAQDVAAAISNTDDRTGATPVETALAASIATPGSAVRTAVSDLAETVVNESGGGGGGGITPAFPPVGGKILDNSMMVPGAYTTMALTANRLYAMPIRLDGPATLTAIYTRMSATATGNCRMGLYTVNSTTYAPDALIVDAGEATTASGTSIYLTLDDLALDAGFVYLALVASGTPTVQAFTASQSPVGTVQANPAGIVTHYYQTFTYGALPDPFGSNSYGTGDVPRIMVNVS